VLLHHLEVKKVEVGGHLGVREEKSRGEEGREKGDQFKVKMKSRKIHRSVLSHIISGRREGIGSVQGEDEITESSSLSAVTSSRRR
jgi:hypothetical protein